MTEFVLGLVIGAFIGLVLGAVLRSGKEEDSALDRFFGFGSPSDTCFDDPTWGLGNDVMGVATHDPEPPVAEVDPDVFKIPAFIQHLEEPLPRLRKERE